LRLPLRNTCKPGVGVSSRYPLLQSLQNRTTGKASTKKEKAKLHNKWNKKKVTRKYSCLTCFPFLLAAKVKFLIIGLGKHWERTKKSNMITEGIKTLD